MVDWVFIIESLRIDHLLIIGSLVSLFFEKGRGFMKDWGPFLLLWITYDLMRGIADNLGYIHVREVYDAELFLFGWLFDGMIPSFYMKEHTNKFLDIFTSGIYSLHMGTPIVVAATIYYVSKNKQRFKEMSMTFLLTSYMALLTFALYPVAPPWYIADEGFTQPDQKVGLAESAAGLIRVDNYFNNNFFGSIYETFNANPFAAMPSLHSAFAFISAFFAIRTYREKTKWIWLFAIYPVCVWFSAVYLQHHYILDLMAGVTYVLIADRITLRYYKWKRGRSIKDDITEVIMEEEKKGNGAQTKTEVEEPLVTNIITENKEN